ncbi:MAG: lysophospholipase [Oscillospiraceae bacterium]|nr:lysophospholipase [Oscillospiraceae bacterium]
MIIHNSFYFDSSDGFNVIHAEEWLPEGRPKAVLEIAHGVAEYIRRYDAFARYLAENGILVVGEDHIGHGQSVMEGMPYIYFGRENGWDNVVSDLHKIRTMYGEKYPDVPYFLMGHSMGSFLARTYLIKYPGDVDGTIIMGTGQQSGALVAGGKLIGNIIGKLNGFDKPHGLVTALAFGSYNNGIEKPRTAYDWLSVNEENVDKYVADPLCGEPATVGLFLDMLGGIGFIRKQENVNKMDKTKPVLFISGDKDPVGENGKGVKAAHATFEKAGVKDLTLKLYPGLRHEILNEDCRQEVYKYILDWIEKRI